MSSATAKYNTNTKQKCKQAKRKQHETRTWGPLNLDGWDFNAARMEICKKLLIGIRFYSLPVAPWLTEWSARSAQLWTINYIFPLSDICRIHKTQREILKRLEKRFLLRNCSWNVQNLFKKASRDVEKNST